MELNSIYKTSDPKEDLVENLQFSVLSVEGLLDTIIIELQGIINTYNVVSFKEHLYLLIKQGYVNIIFDMTHIEYISASGVGLFIQLLSTIRKESGDIILTGLQSNVAEIFDISGLSDFFTVSSSVKYGLKMFKNNRNY